jgi:hypothetical protein
VPLLNPEHAYAQYQPEVAADEQFSQYQITVLATCCCVATNVRYVSIAEHSKAPG